MAKKKTPNPTQFNKGLKGNLSEIKSRSGPLGGAPEVKIPPLDAEPITGPGGEPLTMQQQAEFLRDPTNPQSPMYDPQLADLAARQEQDLAAMDPMAAHRPQPQPVQSRRTAGPFGGIGGPTLPPEATKDPRFVQGVGSMYAQNQPAASMRRAQRGRAPLSEETVEGLEALKNFQGAAQQEQEKQSEEVTRADVDKQIEEGSFEALRDLLDGADPEEFFSQFRRQIDELSTAELRKSIEDRCEPMSIEQMLEDGELRQDVPIVRNKFCPTYRTLSGEESLSVKREMFGVQGGDVYVNELLSMYQLTAGLFALNGKPLPSHLDEKRRFNKDKFYEKFRRVRSFPTAMLASLSINFQWFDQRSRRLFVDLEELKNG